MEHWHIDALRDEEDYVRRRYSVVAVAMAEEPFRVRRKAAAEMFGIGIRQLFRLLARFKKEGIKGLRDRSKRPHSSPGQTDEDLTRKIVAVREATGLGPKPIADLLNESMRRSGTGRKVWPSTVYNVLVRTGLIEKEEYIQKRWKRFERGRPGQLMQADLTLFNGVNILTLEDDHSRKAWSLALPNARDDTVIGGMRALLTKRYDNLLTTAADSPAPTS